LRPASISISFLTEKSKKDAASVSDARTPKASDVEIVSGQLVLLLYNFEVNSRGMKKVIAF